MNIIVSESQYNKVIDRFITSLLKPDKIWEDMHTDTFYWVKNDHIIGYYKKNSAFINFENRLWWSIKNLFDLSHIETQYYLRQWLQNHYNLEKLVPSDNYFEKSGNIDSSGFLVHSDPNEMFY